MILADLQLILAKMGVASQYLTPVKDRQLLIPCPLAKWTHSKGTDRNPSCSICFGDPAQPTLFQCFSCKEKGKLWYLVHSFGEFAGLPDISFLGLQLTQSDEPSLLAILDHATQDFNSWVYDPTKDALAVLPDHLLESFPDAWGVGRARTYLEQERGYDYDRVKDWQLKWHANSNRIMFPVRDQKLQLVGGVGRAIFKETQPKYYNFFQFETGQTLGGLHRVTGQPKVAVVEGWNDVVNIWDIAQRYEYDVVCTFTSKMSQAQAEMLLSLDASIHFFYDLDDEGTRGWMKAYKMLSPLTFGLKRATWPNKLLDVGQFDEVQWKYALRSLDSF